MVRPSRLFGLLAAFAACGALCLGALAGPAAGLSDAEYREMMKDRGFAEADRALNEAWSKILKEEGLSEAGIEALKADQAEWVRKGRDAAARRYMTEDDYTALEAYTTVTGMRAEALPDLAERIFLQDRPDGPQGYYVRREDGRETSRLSVRWTDKEAGEVRVGMEANLVLGPKDVEYRYWSGEGTVRKGVLKADGDYDGQGSATFTFDGDRVQVVVSQDIAPDVDVTLDGTYVRQKLPKP
mgnify:FL=1